MPEATKLLVYEALHYTSSLVAQATKLLVYEPFSYQATSVRGLELLVEEDLKLVGSPEATT